MNDWEGGGEEGAGGCQDRVLNLQQKALLCYLLATDRRACEEDDSQVVGGKFMANNNSPHDATVQHLICNGEQEEGWVLGRQEIELITDDDECPDCKFINRATQTIKDPN